jgi:hypothetical protein
MLRRLSEIIEGSLLLRFRLDDLFDASQDNRTASLLTAERRLIANQPSALGHYGHTVHQQFMFGIVMQLASLYICRNRASAERLGLAARCASD